MFCSCIVAVAFIFALGQIGEGHHADQLGLGRVVGAAWNILAEDAERLEVLDDHLLEETHEGHEKRIEVADANH